MSLARLVATRHPAAAPGPRLVLVHGFTQTGASFAPLLPLLSGWGEVVTVDLPGHGASSTCAVADLEEAADLLGEAAGTATYLGYSLGGRTCLTLALRHPELVERLVLVGASAGIEDPDERAARRAADEALAERIERGGSAGLGDFLAEWLAGPLFSHLRPEQAGLEARLANTPAGLAASLRTCGTGTQTPSWGRLHELAMPVLAVAGARDERFRALATRLVAAVGPSARLALVARAGHAACFEEPEAFGALLAGFLEETADAGSADEGPALPR